MATLALTQVPHFGTEVQGSNAEPTRYHEVTTHSDGISNDQDAILRGFARFVAEISDTAQPFFGAQLPDRDCIVGAEVSTAAGDRSCTSLRVHLQDAGDVQDGHFCISVTRGKVAAGVVKPDAAVQLIVVSDDDSALARLTMTLRVSHGPLEAATHLLKMTVQFLRVETHWPAIMLSRFNVPDGLEALPDDGSLQSFPTPALTTSTCDNPAVVHTAFEKQCKSRPDNVLIEHLYFDDESSAECIDTLTYKQVHARATKLAQNLMEIERYADWKPMAGQQRAVPILLPTCPELIVAILGVLKAGYAVCPLAVDRPGESLLEVLGDLQAVPVIGMGSDSISSHLRPGGHGTRSKPSARFIWIDVNNVDAWRHEQRFHAAPVIARPLPAVLASDIAYVIFTSGSTGKPKGVLVPHGAMVASISSFSQRAAAHLPTGPRLRWFVMNLPSFDAYQLDLLLVILRGGTLCLPERSLLLTDVEGAINRMRPTATTTVSSLAVILRPEKLPTLRTIVVGGEMLHQKVVANFAHKPIVNGSSSDRLRRRATTARHLINGYGPTETAIVVATADMTVTTRGSMIGSVLPTALVVIIDPLSEEVRELPAGVAGELAIGGPQLSAGYLNRPVETAQAFVTCTTLGRLYRTGDKARVVWSADGRREIEMLGRLTLDQVKINGRRMELGEVESCVLGVADVREAAVAVVQESMLTAFLVLRNTGGGRSRAAQVMKACHRQASEHLAPWMCPSSYHIVESLPRTPNDKIDRRQLTRLAMEALDAQQVDPNTGVTRTSGKTCVVDRPSSTGSELAARVEASHPSEQAEVLEVNLSPQEAAHAHQFNTIEQHHRRTSPEPTATSELPAMSAPQAASRPSMTSKPTNAVDPSSDTEAASVEIVYQALSATIGDGVRSHLPETPTSSIGLDSIRAMTFLRTLRDKGVVGLTIMDVLSSPRIQNIVAKVEHVISEKGQTVASGSEREGTTPEMLNGNSGAKQGKDLTHGSHRGSPHHSHRDGESESRDAVFGITSSDVNGPDPSREPDTKSISVDDEDAIYALSAKGKLRHYDYHNRSDCATALNLREDEIEQVLPATGIQIRLLYLATEPVYNDPTRYQGKAQIDHVLYQVPTGMDAGRLQRSIETVIARHDIFRTLFTPTKHPLAEYAQVVLAASSPRAAIRPRIICLDEGEEDVLKIATSAVWKEKLKLAQDEAEQSMTLDTPPIRLSYVQSSGESPRYCIIIFSLFHGIYDGVAFRLLRAAIAAEYEGISLDTQLLPFRSAVEGYLAADWLDATLFLMSRYANVPVFRMGRLRAPGSLLREYDQLHYRLYPSSSHMRRFSIRSRITMSQLMGQKQKQRTGLPISGHAAVQAAWTKMLGQTLGLLGGAAQDKSGSAPTYVEFATAVHGRYTDDARRTVGPLLAGLPMMVPLSDIQAKDMSNRQVCALLSAQQHQLLGHISMPCPNMDMAQVGMDRSDTGLVLQIHDLQSDATSNMPDLPFFHHDLNVLPPVKPMDTGFVILTEVWAGMGGLEDNLTIMCSYNSQRPGYEFLSRSWVLSALVSFDEAMADIISHPDRAFCASPANGQS